MRKSARVRLALAIAASALLERGAGPVTPPMDPAIPPALARSVEETLAAREYEASWTERGLQAPNRAQNLRTYFESDRVRIHDRTAPGSPELLALRLESIGREGSRQAVSPGELEPRGARVEIRRPGLVEWYENRPQGLEQGFTLESRPGGAGPLRVELTLHAATAHPLGDGLELRARSGRRLRYAGLVARDAGGAELTAGMETSGSALHLVVDDAGARYPLTIDPLLEEARDTSLESDQANALFGASVAGAGDINGDGHADVIIGAPQFDAGEVDEGAAFIFHGGPGGITSGNVWIAAARLEPDQAGASFGVGVAGAGDVNGDGYDDVIVGAELYSAGQSGEGAAFIFHGGPGGIASSSVSSAATRLEADQAFANLGGSGNFHGSVAGAGDVDGDGYADVIVGAPYYDSGEIGEGAAFVFHGGPGGVESGNPSTADGRIESDQSGANLGISVASAGDVNADGYADVIAGAPSYSAGETGEGAAFIFHGGSGGITSGGASAAQTRIESNQSFSSLGTSVAGAGDVNGDGRGDVIVGAVDYDADQINEGVAFLFRGGVPAIPNGSPASAAAWLETNTASARGGEAVAGAGDLNGDGYADVVLGAPQRGTGMVQVFLGGPWTNGVGARRRSDSLLEEGSESFGWAVAGAGDVDGDGYADLVVGASRHSASQSAEGGAFVFLGGGRGIGPTTPSSAAAQIELDQSDTTHMGLTVAGAGDINGDGYGDILVGAPAYDSGQTREGAAFVFLGGPNGIPDANPVSASTRIESNHPNSMLGASVAGAGDVNGDGYADVIIGAPGYDLGQPDESGAAFIFHGVGGTGIPHGDPSTAATRLHSDQDASLLGSAVAGAGDVDGDGLAEVIVGAWGYASDERGAAFVFHGGRAGIASGHYSTARTRIEGDRAEARLGSSVSGAGDVNGDGYADVVIGAPGYGAGESGEGAAFVFHGAAGGIPSGDSSTASTHFEANRVDAALGKSVAVAGDVNGDGYADVVLGAPGNGARPGAAYVLHGGPGGIPDGDPSTAPTEISGPDGMGMGTSVAGAGDVDSDGFADVIVGEPGAEGAAGAAYVFRGRPGGIPDGGSSSAHDPITGSPAASWHLGASVAGAGDVNGDGFGDVLVSAPLYDAGQPDEPAAFVFAGNQGVRGKLAWLRQWRQSSQEGDRVVHPWGFSHPTLITFQISVGSKPAGRAAITWQAEFCPLGALFGSPACRIATGLWIDSTLGTILGGAVDDLSRDTLYHWRGRALYAPLAVTKPGITPPPRPAHGPWRRLNAQLVEGDFRTDRDSDLDGLGNWLDRCPYYTGGTQTDTDGDGRGDSCECTDQDGDGYNNVLDMIAINLAIFDPDLVTALCDGNLDGLCNVNDMVAANLEIFSPGNTSICSRQPVPGP